jgi:hypothetical protein
MTQVQRSHLECCSFAATDVFDTFSDAAKPTTRVLPDPSSIVAIQLREVLAKD